MKSSKQKLSLLALTQTEAIRHVKDAILKIMQATGLGVWIAGHQSWETFKLLIFLMLELDRQTIS